MIAVYDIMQELAIEKFYRAESVLKLVWGAEKLHDMGLTRPEAISFACALFRAGQLEEFNKLHEI